MNSWRTANEPQERTYAWLHEFIPVNELQKDTLLIVLLSWFKTPRSKYV